MTDIWYDFPSRELSASIHPVIVVDLNGTLDNYAGWTGQYADYAPLPGTAHFLHLLSARFKVVVVTAQPDDRLQAVVDWLMFYDLSQYVVAVTNRKIPAIAYVDDRALCFRGWYAEVLDELDDFRTWWEQNGHADGPSPDQKSRLGLG